MSELKTFKCPNCDGRLEFDTASQHLKCPYCDGEFDPAVFDEGKEYTVSNEKWDDDAYLVYTCKSCGGTIMADQHTAADSCRPAAAANYQLISHGFWYFCHIADILFLIIFINQDSQFLTVLILKE